jgi:NIPSNAP
MMIRRYYILPLRPAVADAKVHELIECLSAADRFIPGLRDSSAGLDVASRTVLWENTFVDEPSYSGPYMVHPYHIGAIDNYVMADSPECITQDIYVARYQTPDAAQHIRGGIRRVLLLNVTSDAEAATIAALAAAPNSMAASAFGADTVGWVSAKGRSSTHVWEQVFTDTDQLRRYLASRDGVACSTLEGFTRLGVHLGSLKIFTCPFALTPSGEQTPTPTPRDDAPVLHTITAVTALDDVDRYVELLEGLYDPFMAGCGSTLVHRWRTVDRGYLTAEVHSTWHLDTLSAYSDLRAKTYADPGWNDFVRDAMPLVQGGSRRFSRPV